MLGAIRFMSDWKEYCNSRRCAECNLSGSCKGAMETISERDILEILSVIYSRKGVEVEEVIHKES